MLSRHSIWQFTTEGNVHDLCFHRTINGDASIGTQTHPVAASNRNEKRAIRSTCAKWICTSKVIHRTTRAADVSDFLCDLVNLKVEMRIHLKGELRYLWQSCSRLCRFLRLNQAPTTKVRL